MNLEAVLIFGAVISLVLTVTSFGMQARMSDVLYLFRRPGQLFRALISINVVMPIIAVLMVELLSLNPAIEAALVALAVSPIPPFQAFDAIKERGARTFAFGLLVAVSIASLFAIPMVFRVLGAVFDRRVEFSELSITRTITTTVLLPLIVGMVIRYLAPRFTEGAAKVLAKIATLLLVISVGGLLIGMLPEIWVFIGDGTIMAAAAFATIGLTIGHLLGGASANNRSVLALTASARHPAIAISLASQNLVDADTKTVVGAVLLYLVVSSMVTVPYLAWLSGARASQRERIV